MMGSTFMMSIIRYMYTVQVLVSQASNEDTKSLYGTPSGLGYLWRISCHVHVVVVCDNLCKFVYIFFLYTHTKLIIIMHTIRTLVTRTPTTDICKQN